MAQVNFGSILQNERERKGLDLASVARRLRIRPDILQAIESADFNRMPPRGYARNMVNAYARYLGLNPTEITKRYLDEAYAYEVKRARSNAQPTGFDMSRAGSSRRGSRRGDDEVATENGRMLFVDNSTNRYQSQEESGRLYTEEQTHRSTRSAVPSQSYTNFYAGPKKPGIFQSRIPLFVGIGVIVILVIVLAIFLFGPKGDNGDSENIQVTGGAEANKTEVVDKDEVDTLVPVAPTQVEVRYSVADGQSAYVEVYVNGNTAPEEASTITGPSEKSYDVVGVIRFDTTNPSAITVSQDGKPIEWTDDNGDGVYSITIDFAAVLAQWQAEHPTAGQNNSPNAATEDSTSVDGDNVSDGASNGAAAESDGASPTE